MTLFLAGGALLMTSCTSEDDDNDGLSKVPFASVTAKDGESTLTATIDDTDKTIKFGEFANTTDLTAVEVTFTMNKGHILKDPAYLTSNVNLTTAYNVIVLVNGTDQTTYTMTAVVPEVPKAVLGAKVGEADAVVGDDNTITVEWQEGMEINHMVFTLELAEGATVKSPEGEEIAFDLEFGDGTLVVDYNGTEITYTVKVTGYEDPMIAKGWEDITADYDPLPAYIKVYKTTKAGGVDGKIGYVAMIGSQAEMACIGDGVSAKKTIAEFEADGAYTVYLVGIDSSSNQLMINDGNIIQPNDRMLGTIGQNADGSYQISYAVAIDSKVYTFPFRASGAYETPTADKGTVWEPKAAVGGLHMILYEGNVLTAENAKTNERETVFYGDADYYARSAVGITKYGKIFAFCGQQFKDNRTADNNVGLSIPELANVMKDLGCEYAIQFEASSTPNMHINKKETALNGKVAEGKDLKPVQCAIAFK